MLRLCCFSEIAPICQVSQALEQLRSFFPVQTKNWAFRCMRLARWAFEIADVAATQLICNEPVGFAEWCEQRERLHVHLRCKSLHLRLRSCNVRAICKN